MFNPTAVSPISIDELLLNQVYNRGADQGLLKWWTVAEAGNYLRSTKKSVASWHIEQDARKEHEQVAGSVVQHHGPIRVLEFQECIVVGQGSLVTRGGNLVEESALEFLAHHRCPDGFSANEGIMSVARAPTREIKGAVLLLKRPWFRNYGHWLVDGAALLSLNVLDRLPEDTKLLVGQCDYPRMQSIIEESVAIIAPQHQIIIHPDNEVWRFSRLFFVTPVHRPPLFKLPAAIRRLREAFVEQSMSPVLNEGDRLFVVRGDEGPRRLTNTASLQAFCRKIGFREIRPETLTLREQALAFSSAKIVVGVKGAALTNLLFCRPGTAVIMLSPGDFPDPFYWDLAEIVGVNLTEIFGYLTRHDLPRGKNPFVIYEGDFISVLNRLTNVRA